MKILLISSSPREKSNTFLLAKEVLNGCVNKDIESEIVFLKDLKIEFCRACELCHNKILSCPIKDDVNPLLEKMLAADGIIFASPNYINHVTASLKAVLDRSSHFIHCSRLSNKYIAGVVSSGSGYNKPVLDYIKYYANICGAQYAGGISSSVAKINKKKEEAFSLGKTLLKNINQKKVHPKQMKIIKEHKEHFKKLIEMRKAEWVGEYNYLKEKGRL